MYYFWTYVFISFVQYFMSTSFYVFPFFGKKEIVITPPLSSFLWPIGLVFSIFGLFRSDGDEEEK